MSTEERAPARDREHEDIAQVFVDASDVTVTPNDEGTTTWTFTPKRITEVDRSPGQ